MCMWMRKRLGEAKYRRRDESRELRFQGVLYAFIGRRAMEAGYTEYIRTKGLEGREGGEGRRGGRRLGPFRTEFGSHGGIT